MFLLEALFRRSNPYEKENIVLRLRQEDTLASRMLIAAILDDVDQIQALIAQGVSPEVEDIPGPGSDCSRPIHYACQFNAIHIVNFLLTQQVDINIHNYQNRRAPLHLAAMHNNIGIVILLVNYGAMIDPEDWSGQTPLQIALNNNYKNMAKFLIQRGANYGLMFYRAQERKKGVGRSRVGPLAWVDEQSEHILHELIAEEGIAAPHEKMIGSLKIFTPEEFIERKIAEETTHLHVYPQEIDPLYGWQYAQCISSRLEHHNHITHLTMNDCGLGDKGLNQLKEFIRITRSLTHLNLERNNISDAGLIDILPGIMENTTLISINLHFNIINDHGAIEFSMMLRNHPTLKRIDFSSNPMGDRGAFALYSALYEKNQPCSSFNLGDTGNKWDVVEITVWTAHKIALSGLFDGEVGHVSLRTFVGGPEGRGIYASFWPSCGDEPLRESADYTVAKFDSAYLRTENYDTEKEERCESTKISLICMNVLAINRIFEQFKSNGQAKWELFGDQNYGDHNCASFVLYLLRCGSGYQLIDPLARKYTTSVVTPQLMLSLVNELRSKLREQRTAKSGYSTFGYPYATQEQVIKHEGYARLFNHEPLLQRPLQGTGYATNQAKVEAPNRESMCIIS